MLCPSVGAFKIDAHLQGYFISLHFHHLSIHWKSVLSSMAKPFKQFVFHIAMFCAKNPHVLQNIVPVQNLMFSRIFLLLPPPPSSTQWHSISLSHFTFTSFIFIHFSDHHQLCCCFAHVLCLLCTHTFCTVWNNQFKRQLYDTCHDTSHCTKHALSSPWLSQHA